MSEPSLPHSLSPLALVGLWSDLEQAYFGKHPFGGNTAEVYAYRLNAGRPENGAGAAYDAASALVDLCLFFAADREAEVTIDGLDPMRWLHDFGEGFNHRCHLWVVPK